MLLKKNKKTMKKLNLIKKTGCCSDVNINEEDIGDDIRLVADRMYIKCTGQFAGNAIGLPEYYDYVLGKDSCGCIILVPLKKAGCCENR